MTFTKSQRVLVCKIKEYLVNSDILWSLKISEKYFLDELNNIIWNNWKCLTRLNKNVIDWFFSLIKELKSNKNILEDHLRDVKIIKWIMNKEWVIQKIIYYTLLLFLFLDVLFFLKINPSWILGLIFYIAFAVLLSVFWLRKAFMLLGLPFNIVLISCYTPFTIVSKNIFLRDFILITLFWYLLAYLACFFWKKYHHYEIFDDEDINFSWYSWEYSSWFDLTNSVLNNNCSVELILINLTEAKNLEEKRKERLLKEQQEEKINREKIESIKKMNPYEFEVFMAEIFNYFWFKTKTTKKSGDDWIDIFLWKWEEKMAVQCKRQKWNVGTPSIRNFIWSMQFANIKKWFFVTTSNYSLETMKMIKSLNYELTLIDIWIIEQLIKAKNEWANMNQFNTILEEWMRNIESYARTNLISRQEWQEKYKYLQRKKRWRKF